MLDLAGCAELAIGAPSSAAAQARLSDIVITFEDLGPLDDPENSRMASYRDGVIRFNSQIDWETGMWETRDLMGEELQRSNLNSINAKQFMDLVLLHELSHAFRGQNHNDNKDQAAVGALNNQIYRACIQGAPPAH
jgi:hypothetical protein